MKKTCWICGSDIAEPIAEKLGTRIEELGLSIRARNCLRRASIEYVEELLLRLETRDELMRVRNLGVKTQEEIIESVRAFGFDVPANEEQGGGK